LVVLCATRVRAEEARGLAAVLDAVGLRMRLNGRGVNSTGTLAKERPQLLDEQSRLFEGGEMPAAVGFAEGRGAIEHRHGTFHAVWSLPPGVAAAARVRTLRAIIATAPPSAA